MGMRNNCIICGNVNSEIDRNPDGGLSYQYCPICGQTIVPETSIFLLKKGYLSRDIKQYDVKKLIAYLFHNKIDNRYAFVGTNEVYEKYKNYKPDTQSFLVTPETVENWYPNTFEERINYILLYLANQSEFAGESIRIVLDDVSPLFFLTNERNNNKWRVEFKFIIRYLVDQGLIDEPHYEKFVSNAVVNLEVFDALSLAISAKAWALVYDLQKNKSNNKNVFVAMKFGKETEALREKIKEGLEGYNVRIMDEIEHNHQIVPEMLYEIRNSKFVIAELSNHNNGAYYEAGYALGLGKEVIHICQKEELSKGLHFDVAQVNTIVYENIDEIPAKLKKRIEATIK